MQTILCVEKYKVHRFFESITLLPNANAPMTLQQIDHMIMNENEDIYTLFQLAIQIRSQQILVQNTFGMFRRLSALIFCISTHQLYDSKIKTLVGFWWEACVKHKKLVYNYNTTNTDLKLFKERILMDEFYFHALRCFNTLLGNYQSLNYHNYAIQQSQVKQILSNIELAASLIKSSLKENEKQVEYKTLLAIEYSKYLLLVLEYKKSKYSDEELFFEFFQSIKIVLRLMKKFYIFSQLKYRESLAVLIQNGYQTFKNSIPSNKCKILQTILSFIQRKQFISKIEKDRPNSMSEGKKISIRLVSRIINGWKWIEQNKMMRRLTLDIYVPHQNAKQVVKETQSQSVHLNCNRICMKVREKLKITNRNQNVLLTPSDSTIAKLKKKRSQSLKLSRQSFTSNFEIKSQVLNEGQKHFSRVKLLRKRCYSTSSTMGSEKVKNQQVAPRQIELKLQDLRMQNGRKKEHHTLKLVPRKITEVVFRNKQN